MKQSTSRPRVDSHYEPIGAYLVLGHGFFMLRLEDNLQWKPEDSANQFELLVTSGHDRIFGEMVQKQQAEHKKKKEMAYRERKLAEKKKAVEDAKNADKVKESEKKAGGQDDKKEEQKGDKEGDAKAANDEKGTGNHGHHSKKKREDQSVTLVPAAGPGKTGVEDAALGSPVSNVKVIEGEEVKPSPAPIIATSGGDEHVVIAVPVRQEVKEVALDKVHEVEVIAAAPMHMDGKDVVSKEKAEKDQAKAEKGDGEKEKDGRSNNEKEKEKEQEEAKARAMEMAKQKARAKEQADFDPMREAELLAKMIQASGGGPEGPVGMDDIKIAFRALEKAAESGMTRSGGGGDPTKKGPLIWTWQDSCERWRWRNYEAGAHQIGPGGWEERDWKMFADDRGCHEYDQEEKITEVEEEDVHDWSC